MSSFSPEDLAAAVAAGMPRLVDDLRRLVSVPSIAFPGFPAKPVLEAAELTAELLREAGCSVRYLQMPDSPPAVFGEIPAPEGAPTVLLYAHYDIQPPGDLDAWESAPYELTERNGRLYGRGAADDKSGICMHLASIRAFDGRLPVGVKVLAEGEEETGGSGLEALVAGQPELFAADVVIVADMGNWRAGEPTLTTALRGITDCIIEVSTLEGPVHSGMYGGPMPDALMALIRALATLTDADATVAIAGVPHGEWEGYEPDEAAFSREAGLLKGVELTGTGSMGSRLWAKPSVSVIGIDAPAVADARNALVHRARAKVSLRVPPGFSPAEGRELLVRHLERAVPWGARVRVTPGVAGPGFAAEDGGPVYAAARDALAFAYGKEPVAMGAGGSIPLVSAFAAALPGAEIVLWGAEDGACQVHAPNESVSVDELERASLAQALLFRLLGLTPF